MARRSDIARVHGAMLSSSSMVDLDSLAPERIRLLRRVEYDELVRLGLFEEERLELLGGVIVEMSPQGAAHSEAAGRLARRFMMLDYQGRARVRIQSSFALDDSSEPEPDLAVVPCADYSRELPSSALLVIEVADSSLRKDREIKAALYAARNVPEYWIVNLVDDVIEVRRDPGASGYRTLCTYGRGETAAPLEFPDFVVAVDDLLPTAQR
jgi:Uma2 family endonuclease